MLGEARRGWSALKGLQTTDFSRTRPKLGLHWWVVNLIPVALLCGVFAWEMDRRFTPLRNKYPALRSENLPVVDSSPVSRVVARAAHPAVDAAFPGHAPPPSPLPPRAP
jgi:hypothetical protein